jgi:hypothetical protein
VDTGIMVASSSSSDNRLTTATLEAIRDMFRGWRQHNTA